MHRRAIVVVIDGLSAGYLGPYGNTWVPTPCFNRLAAESLLADFALTDTVDLNRVYRSYWTGLHALAEERPAPSLPSRLRNAGLHAVLLTDDSQLAELDAAGEFAERVVIAPEPRAAAIDDPLETSLARLLATALLQWEAMRGGGCLWIHARGMQGPWDAPYSWRGRFADEDDPEPPAWLTPPDGRLDADVDPDLLLGLQQAYAAQVTLVDHCLEPLAEAIGELPEEAQPLLAVTAPRGYPLGEHGWVGRAAQAPHSESLHVPCLIRYPECPRGVRLSSLVQPPDVFATLCEWLGLPSEPRARWGRSLRERLGTAPTPREQSAYSVVGHGWGLRTPAWFLTWTPQRTGLYVKPDDRWEVNDIGTLRRDAMEAMVSLQGEVSAAAREDRPDQLSPLPELLVDAVD